MRNKIYIQTIDALKENEIVDIFVQCTHGVSYIIPMILLAR